MSHTCRRDEKTGPGLKHFIVDVHEKQTRCFSIVRIDGTKEDFSYVKVGDSCWAT